jgi:hypothetical protein
MICVSQAAQAQETATVEAQASALGPITTFDEPIQEVCELGSDIVAYIRGHLGDLLLIKWRDKIVYYRDAESREIMGGGRLGCGELIWWDDKIAVLVV